VDLPEMVQRFHSLYPLEDMNRDDEIPSSAFGVRTMIFKGISSSDGQAYALRRIDSRQVTLSPFGSCSVMFIDKLSEYIYLLSHARFVLVL
jgi:hypothetical protein